MACFRVGRRLTTACRGSGGRQLAERAAAGRGGEGGGSLPLAAAQLARSASYLLTLAAGDPHPAALGGCSARHADQSMGEAVQGSCRGA